jgi:hypothetical protein
MTVNGHRFLPSGGHRTSPPADVFAPPLVAIGSPRLGGAPVVAEPSPYRAAPATNHGARPGRASASASAS